MHECPKAMLLSSRFAAPDGSLDPRHLVNEVHRLGREGESLPKAIHYAYTIQYGHTQQQQFQNLYDTLQIDKSCDPHLSSGCYTTLAYKPTNQPTNLQSTVRGP
jgi:hypothetical protein